MSEVIITLLHLLVNQHQQQDEKDKKLRSQAVDDDHNGAIMDNDCDDDTHCEKNTIIFDLQACHQFGENFTHLASCRMGIGQSIVAFLMEDTPTCN